MTKDIQVLSKQLGLWFKEDTTSSEMAYFDYCMLSYQNGNFTQCRELFSNMRKKDRKGLISYISNCYDNYTERDIYKFYFNLL